MSLLFAALLAQYTYYGPIPPTNEKLVRVEVLVYDEPGRDGKPVQSATFDKKPIPLKPRDIYNFRGSAAFDLKPGSYELAWVVQRDPTVWPRTVNYTKQVELNPNDFWVQVKIEGDEASVD